MQFVLSLVLLLNAVVLSAQVKWMSMDEALSAQKSNPKKIIIDFYADWCAPCKEMEKLTYGNPEISEVINTSYYAVKFNIESAEPVNYMGRTFSNPTPGKKRSRHSFSEFMNIRAVPSAVILDETARPITDLNGFLTVRELEPYLQLFSDNSYKSIKTRDEWDAYQRKFKSKIK